MTVVCCGCHKIIKKGGYKISHGYCEKCYKLAVLELDISLKNFIAADNESVGSSSTSSVSDKTEIESNEHARLFDSSISVVETKIVSLPSIFLLLDLFAEAC